MSRVFHIQEDSGLAIDQLNAGSVLRLPQPTDVGEVIYSPENPSFREKWWYYKKNWNRRIQKYREIYLVNHNGPGAMSAGKSI